MNAYDLYKKREPEIRKEWFKDHVPDFVIFSKDFIKIKWKKPGEWNCAIVYYLDLKMGYLLVAGDLGEAVYQWSGPISLNFVANCNLDYFDSKCQASSCGERGREWNSDVAIDYVRSHIKESIELDDNFYNQLYDDQYIDDLIKEKDIELWRSINGEPEVIDGIEEYPNLRGWKELSSEEKKSFKKLADEYIEKISSSKELKNISKNDYRRKVIENKNKFEDFESEAISACEYEGEWHHFIHQNGYDFFGDEYYEYSQIGRVISLRVQSHLIGLKMILDGLDSGKFKYPKIPECPVKKFLSWLKFWRKPQKRRRRTKLSAKSRYNE